MRKEDLVKTLALRTGKHPDVLNRYKATELAKMVAGSVYELSFDQCKMLLESIRKTGGASYRPFDNELNPSTGYMVALVGFERKVNRVWNTEDLRHVLNQWLSDISYTGDSIAFIGIWEHEDKLYLDLSQRFTDREMAVVTGQQRNQISIWDCVNKTEIKTS